MWIQWMPGKRVGEWSSTEFASREEALDWARTRGVETVVSEVPPHHTLPYERVTVRPDGREVSERCVSI
jgi:hypothetical protein